MGKRSWFFLLLAGRVIVALGAGALLFGRLAETEPPPAAIPALVREVHTLSRPLYVAVSGAVEAPRSVQVGFRRAGGVARVGHGLVPVRSLVRQGGPF